jgi:hypothetical protein
MSSHERPLTATVDNTEYVIGGWSKYETSRRRVLEENPYAGRTYVTNLEVAEDLLASTKKWTMKPMLLAANSLAAKLEALEQRQPTDDEALTLPDLTADDVRDFASFLREEDWGHHLEYVNRFAKRLVAIGSLLGSEAIGGGSDDGMPKVEPLKVKYYPANNSDSQLEEESLGYIAQLEHVLKWLAEKMDSLAHAL